MEHRSKGTFLITGIEGFTGFHLKAFLERKGYDVFGTSLEQSGEKVFRVDINNKNSLCEILEKVNPDYIIHLAAISFVGHPNFIDFYKVNTIGTQSLLNAILSSNIDIKKILIPSSATVYGNQNSTTLDEMMVPAPNNHYGCSKLSMELIAATFFDKLPIIVTRPFNYTGVGQSEVFLVPKIVSHFKNSKSVIELGNLDTYREFNDVNFVCECYHELMIGNSASSIVNVCSGVTHSVSDILSELKNITGIEIEISVNREFVRENEIRSLNGSIERLSEMIDFPQAPSLNDTLNRMISNI